MAEIIFTYEGNQINIQCDKNQKMDEICNKLSTKINMNINSLIFLYGGSQLNLNKKLNEITKENKINILVFKKENESEICPKCGRVLNNEIIDNIIFFIVKVFFGSFKSVNLASFNNISPSLLLSIIT